MFLNEKKTIDLKKYNKKEAAIGSLFCFKFDWYLIKCNNFVENKNVRLVQLFFLLLFPFVGFSQIRSESGEKVPVQQDTAQKPPISAYKIISVEGDTTFVDTTITIQKYYKFNYLRKDDFEYIPFSNVGRPYNRLSFDFDNEQLLPGFGAQARHPGFFEIEDIFYYEVPTPLTEVFYKTVPGQGQILDAFLTVNTSPRLNFSVGYKGVRSLGIFQNELTSTGIFRVGLSYNTQNEKYWIKTHFVSQNLFNQENGGLNPLALQQYTTKEEGFDDRALLEVKFENAENNLSGKRFYLDHSYDLITSKNNHVSLMHRFYISDKDYEFYQDNAVEIFGESFRESNLKDELELRIIDNVAGVSFNNPLFGKLTGKAGFTYFKYGYDSFFVLADGQIITNTLTGENYKAGAEYLNSFGPLSVSGDLMINLGGEYTGHFFEAAALYSLGDYIRVFAKANSNERAPNFNFLLYQSDYFNYNWQNNFGNRSVRSFSVGMDSEKLFNVEGSINQIENYTFFAENEEGAIKPFQFNGRVNYLKIRANREFSYRNFSLDNTLMFQQVSSGSEVFKVPTFVTRNTLYYGDHWFKKALFVQTGLSFKYFTPYEMNGYDPVLAEFYVQDDVEIGGFPAVDFFFNGKIKQTRLFFSLDNVNFLLSGNNNFSAPEYPYGDYLLRFGIVWNFFL